VTAVPDRRSTATPDGRSPLVAAVSAYAGRVLPTLLADGGATSPLAPWLLAALVAPAVSGKRRATLERILGRPADQAADLAGSILDHGPRSLRTALALWRRPDLAANGELGSWERRLPARTGRGPIPTQAGADEWTRLQTAGLINRFPAAVGPLTLAVLAAAIAAKARWDRPLERAWGGENAWKLKNMLSADPVGVFESKAGMIGVARSVSTDDEVAVYSFIAAPNVEREAHVKAALGLLSGWFRAADPERLARRRAVPVAKLEPRGHAWTVEPSDGSSAIVPAFAEKTDSANILALPGIAEAAATLAEMVRDAMPVPQKVEIGAAMSAVARYDRLGFEAAAVAAMMITMSAMMDQQPQLLLRFDRPHLAVAVSTDMRYRGLPMFAAWVDVGVCEPAADRM
jgi:hypothetical protein